MIDLPDWRGNTIAKEDAWRVMHGLIGERDTLRRVADILARQVLIDGGEERADEWIAKLLSEFPSDDPLATEIVRTLSEAIDDWRHL